MRNLEHTELQQLETQYIASERRNEEHTQLQKRETLQALASPSARAPASAREPGLQGKLGRAAAGFGAVLCQHHYADRFKASQRLGCLREFESRD